MLWVWKMLGIVEVGMAPSVAFAREIFFVPTIVFFVVRKIVSQVSRSFLFKVGKVTEVLFFGTATRRILIKF
jgi:hypothetical protein